MESKRFGGISNDQPAALWFENTLNRWTVFNPASVELPAGAAFNVYLPPPTLASFYHRTVRDSIYLTTSFVDHPLTNGRPDAKLLVTQAVRRIGILYTYSTSPVGVWYEASRGQWGIFNQDVSNMGEGLSFSVTVLADNADNAFVHTVSASSPLSELDHRLANNNPHARILITPNWNPTGGVGVHNNHNPGVRYTENGRWAIFNQDDQPLPAGAAFNVLVIGHKIYLPAVSD